MLFWTRRKSAKERTPETDTGKVQASQAPVRRNPPAPCPYQIFHPDRFSDRDYGPCTSDLKFAGVIPRYSAPICLGADRLRA